MNTGLARSPFIPAGAWQHHSEQDHHFALVREGSGLSLLTRLRRPSTANAGSASTGATAENSAAENSTAENSTAGSSAATSERSTNEADPPAGNTDRPGDLPHRVLRLLPGLLRRWARPLAAALLTALATALVLAALVAPNEPAHLTPAAFLRVPAELLLGVALVLVLPSRSRRVTAALLGALLGLVTIGKALDIGFHTYLSRPFDPVFDWTFFRPAYEFLADSMGRNSANGLAVAAIALALVVLVLMILSVMRLARLVARHRTRAGGAAGVLAVVWVVCALLAVQVVPEVPVATASAYDRISQVWTSLQDREAFAAELAEDDFAGVPGEQLLTALRGKDVIIAFVESYGRDAVQNPEFAPQIGAVLADGDRRLRTAGLESRSAFLTSPVAGGGSWLAHASLLAGLWIDNQQRYRTLVDTDRLTLNRAFQRAGWRSVAVMPGIIRDWPEGEFFGYDRIYGNAELNYQGPRMNWAKIPDQYTLATMHRLERAATDRAPVMVEMPLASSHAPWLPLAQLIDWDDVGDGSVYEDMPGAGVPADPLWREPDRARPNYTRAISYTLETLISYLETYGDEDLVMVFLGDHQPAALITGEDATRDAPISIVTGDPQVLDRIAGWGWQSGLHPGPEAPLWQMDEFRDRFLTAFGPTGGN